MLFAYLSSYYPQYVWTFLLLSFVAMLAVTLFASGRAASTLLKDVEHVKRGRVLLSVSRDAVTRLKSKDRVLSEELSKQASANLPQIILLPVLFIVMLIPAVRDTMIFYVNNLISHFDLSYDVKNFLSFLLFYGMIMATFQLAFHYSRRKVESLGGKLEIPLFYVVTENGLLLEERIPLRAPLKVLSMRVDTRRRFVELRVRAPVGGTSRYRLYFDEPRTLEDHLRGLTEESG